TQGEEEGNIVGGSRGRRRCQCHHQCRCWQICWPHLTDHHCRGQRQHQYTIHGSSPGGRTGRSRDRL
ncbi:hypothetical protein NDU88_004092, partial [Pleurodeles waltl]